MALRFTRSIKVKGSDTIRKMEEQIGKAKLIDFNATQILTNKILEILCQLRKGNKKYFDLN